jgi:hypothetical protein
MQNILIKIEIDANQYDEYQFTMFDLTAVFSNYRKYVKPAGKRKFMVTQHWDRVYSRHNNIPEPFLSIDVMVEARKQIIDKVQVKTWAQYKPYF